MDDSLRRAPGTARASTPDPAPTYRCVVLPSGDLLPIGARRRDWKATLISDGYLIVRHPDLETTLAMADRVGTDLKLFAG